MGPQLERAVRVRSRRGAGPLDTDNLHPASSRVGNNLLFTPFAINAKEEVVGAYAFGNVAKFGSIEHAFIASADPSSPFYGGVDLNTLLPPKSGWILTSATGINDAGQIVGYGINPSGKYSGYELTPAGNQVPEPSVLAFFGMVCAGMAVRAAARRRRERLPRP